MSVDEMHDELEHWGRRVVESPGPANPVAKALDLCWQALDLLGPLPAAVVSDTALREQIKVLLFALAQGQRHQSTTGG